ncbi:FUN14 domain-containing protein 1 isoform X2 [Apis laboriosa]|uniref:FUN14 domain-containing protein 1 isoform X2 n=1 Tax=Apis mellifera TaxID=7460 RepID=A0A7M7GTL8_APIME|nr:FUN14 domain-containing protein 1 isoform X2 [Apis mellifera]XP_006612148.1 FUN14 domain-containing protein 1 isoform X2 [Apis dorsata]XP_043795631.1 FUN14 domain-containing protein 1 isoform X2 [Apis laboriosa]|eukprot:XP_006562106.1 FUN14 domain-containing protein 1 isoform X2 [Apis mellifera]
MYLKTVKMSLPVTKKNKDNANKEELNISKHAESMIDKILGDVNKKSTTKQIIIGTTSGWLTGFITIKIGKITAFAVGGGIIMLQIAAHQGYIKINWDKIQKKAEKITDKVEETVTGEGPKFLDKVERYVDKKLDKAEQLLKNGESRTRRWYHSITGDTSFKPTEFHFFLSYFVGGFALGIVSGKLI